MARQDASRRCGEELVITAHRGSRLKRLVAGGLVTLAAATTFGGEQPSIVGYVLQIEGANSEAFSWSRHGRNVALEVFAAVEQGDEIQVRSPAARILLMIGDQEVQVTHEKPFRATGEGLVPDRLRNIVASLLRLFDSELSAAERMVSMSPRGRRSESGPLWIPLLAAPSPKIVAGQRQLRIAWAGGAAPFSARLLSMPASGAAIELLRVETADRSVEWAGDLKEGPYTFELREADGSGLSGRFDAVSSQPRPFGAREPHAASRSDKLSALMDAAQLAGLEGGEWALEAYQSLVELAPTYGPAGELAEALRTGDRSWSTKRPK